MPLLVYSTRHRNAKNFDVHDTFCQLVHKKKTREIRLSRTLETHIVACYTSQLTLTNYLILQSFQYFPYLSIGYSIYDRLTIPKSKILHLLQRLNA